MEQSVKDVQRFKIWRDIPPPILRSPKGPHPGAVMTTRNMVIGQFTQQTGISTGSGFGNYVVQNSSSPIYGQLSFCLADLNQVTTFSSMFDRYRFEKVQLRFTSRNQSVSVFNIASPNNTVPSMLVAVDRDDSTAPASTAALTEYDNSINIPGTCSFDLTLIPSVVSTIANASSSATSSVIHRSDEEWLDIAATNIPNFGVKFAITSLPVSTSAAWYWDIEAWYVISFKNVR